jgi:HEAT repeat protein
LLILPILSIELALSQVPNSDIGSLIKDLKDQDNDVRSNAAQSLGEIGSVNITDAAEPLIQALNDSDPNVRSNAAIALGKIGDPLFPRRTTIVTSETLRLMF